MTAALPAAPVLYECEVRHVRTTPLRNAFRYGGYLWLVDLDDLPRLPALLRPLARFRPRDHLSGAPGSIRANLDAYLAGEGLDADELADLAGAAGGRVFMLTSARVLGYVFNPLTVYWCFGADRGLVAVVAEVHNTYGGRHCYLVRTDARGRAATEKDFYVSPFEPATGATYHLSLPVPGDGLDLTITLHRPGAALFVAAVRGSRLPASSIGLVRMAVRHPLAPLVAALRIRRQGIGLWLRGLPVVPRPRPEHRPEHRPEYRPEHQPGPEHQREHPPGQQPDPDQRPDENKKPEVVR